MTGQIHVTQTVITAQLSAPISARLRKFVTMFRRTGLTMWRLRYLAVVMLTIASAASQWHAAIAQDDNAEINLQLRKRALERLNSPEAYTENLKHREVVNGVVLEEIPESLDNEAAKEALTVRVDVPVYAHNPVWGATGAAVTIIEFSDVSCVDCVNHYKTLADLKTRYGDEIRWIHKHLPQNPYQATNLTAFYGKIAQRLGNFWDYRFHLLNAKDRAESTLMDALAKAGVDLTTMQREVRLNARDIYRELDSDVQLGLRQRMTAPPYIFVNGVVMGDKIPFTALEDFVRFELAKKKRPLPNRKPAKGEL